MAMGAQDFVTRELLPVDFIQECRRRLLDMRTELLNRTRAAVKEFENRDRSGGDEADMTMAILAENNFLVAQARAKERLVEVDQALARIDQGVYGLCEETEQPIETERLRALPWTRLSIEGAEIREALTRRFAR